MAMAGAAVAKPLVPIVLASTLEAFRNSFRSRLPPDTLEALRREGLNLSQLRPVCPLPLWEQAIRLAGEAIYPERSPEEGWVQIGQEVVGGYVETTVGKAVLSLARLLGIRRAMNKMVQSFESSTNYVASKLVELGERELEVQIAMRPEFRTSTSSEGTCSQVYRLGLMRGGLKILGASDFQVELRRHGSSDRPTCYHIRWE